jgi:pyruvate ferredoxin oxidoreductase alpha subunit
MRKALNVIKQVHKDYSQQSGRSYGNGLVEAYKLDDAKIATVCLGSTAGTVKTRVDELRENGIKAGLLRIRAFRPLPVQDIVNNLSGKMVIAVLDRACSFGGNGGPLFHEVRHAMYDVPNKPQILNYIYGLGGRDTPPQLIDNIYQSMNEIEKTGQIEKNITFIGLRE